MASAPTSSCPAPQATASCCTSRRAWTRRLRSSSTRTRPSSASSRAMAISPAATFAFASTRCRSVDHGTEAGDRLGRHDAVRTRLDVAEVIAIASARDLLRGGALPATVGLVAEEGAGAARRFERGGKLVQLVGREAAHPAESLTTTYGHGNVQRASGPQHPAQLRSRLEALALRVVGGRDVAAVVLVAHTDVLERRDAGHAVVGAVAQRQIAQVGVEVRHTELWE